MELPTYLSTAVAAAPQSAAQQAPAVYGIRAGPAREQTGEAAAYAGRQQASYNLMAAAECLHPQAAENPAPQA